MKTIIAVSAVLVCLAAFGLLGLEPYREWRQRRLVTQARAFVDKGDFQNAKLALQRAITFKPRDADVSRMLADLARRSGSPNEIGWRQLVTQTEPHVLSNQVALAAAAARFRNFGEAERALQGVSELDRMTTTYQRARAELALVQNQRPKAELHFKEVLRLEPDNVTNRYNLATVQLGSQNPQIVRDARAALVEISNDPSMHVRALRVLTKDAFTQGQIEEALLRSAELVSAASHESDDRVLRLNVLAKAGDGPAIDRYLKSLFEDTSLSGSDVSGLATWLVANNRVKQARQWLEGLSEPLSTVQPVQIAKAVVLEKDQAWTVLSTNLQDQAWGEYDFLRNAIWSHSLRKLDREMGAKAKWFVALNHAKERLDALSQLASLANTWGWQSETEDALWRIVDRFPDQTQVLDALFRHYSTAGNALGLRKTCQVIYRRAPDKPAIKCELAILSLLLQLELPQAHRLARDVFETDPARMEYVVTYAYSLHLQDKTEEGAALIHDLRPDDFSKPTFAVYAGAVLAAAGEEAEAKRLFEKAKEGVLLEEEKKLVTEAMNTLAKRPASAQRNQ